MRNAPNTETPLIDRLLETLRALRTSTTSKLCAKRQQPSVCSHARIDAVIDLRIAGKSLELSPP
jgi:hypothetical protein